MEKYEHQLVSIRGREREDFENERQRLESLWKVEKDRLRGENERALEGERERLILIQRKHEEEMEEMKRRFVVWIVLVLVYIDLC